jgi:choline-glycine betaine transporter
LIALFFISGADAAAIVMATMASRGSLEPPRLVVVVLGALMGGIACAMLLVGGLTALQQAAILGAVPFTFVIIGVAWCWIKALREEQMPGRDGTAVPSVRTPTPVAAGQPTGAGGATAYQRPAQGERVS